MTGGDEDDLLGFEVQCDKPSSSPHTHIDPHLSIDALTPVVPRVRCHTVVARDFGAALASAQGHLAHLSPAPSAHQPSHAGPFPTESELVEERTGRERAVCAAVQSLHELGRSEEAFAFAARCYGQEVQQEGGGKNAELPDNTPPSGPLRRSPSASPCFPATVLAILRTSRGCAACLWLSCTPLCFFQQHHSPPLSSREARRGEHEPF